MTTEKWIPASGFEGIYEVSLSGKVKRVLPSMGAAVGKVLKQHTNEAGYKAVTLRKNGKYQTKYVHRLLLESFSKESHETVNHKNGVKSDNRLENLEWCSNKDNLIHACRVLGKRRGTNHWASKLNEKSVAAIRKMVSRGATHQMAADKYGVSRISVTYIVSRKTWKHVS